MPVLGFSGMIRNIPPALPSTIRREALHPYLGRLNKIPMELIFLIFNRLDFARSPKSCAYLLKARRLLRHSQYTDKS